MIRETVGNIRYENQQWMWIIALSSGWQIWEMMDWEVDIYRGPTVFKGPVWCRFWCFVCVLYRRSSSSCWSSLCSSWTLFLARNSYLCQFCSKVKLLSAAASCACKPCSTFSGKIQKCGHFLECGDVCCCHFSLKTGGKNNMCLKRFIRKPLCLILKRKIYYKDCRLQKLSC
jgi:hypothetical protein